MAGSPGLFAHLICFREVSVILPGGTRRPIAVSGKRHCRGLAHPILAKMILFVPFRGGFDYRSPSNA